jgi:hypothetical protein
MHIAGIDAGFVISLETMSFSSDSLRTKVLAAASARFQSPPNTPTSSGRHAFCFDWISRVGSAPRVIQQTGASCTGHVGAGPVQ